MAWTSSKITQRAVRSTDCPDFPVSIRKRDSGVVIKMCGGDLVILRRSLCGVSPVLTLTLKPDFSSHRKPPDRSASFRSPSRGFRRFSRMSLAKDLSGDT